MKLRDDASFSRSAGFLVGGGEMGARIRTFDWASSPLGSPDAWPQALKTLVGVLLASNQPMFVAWGPGRTLLYNDPYAGILADKHPAALGSDFLDAWHEIRGDLIPIVEQAYRGEPVHMDDIELIMHRKGYPEEAHFAFSYTPVRDEAGVVAGLFCPCTETTGQVLADRRIAAEIERQRQLFAQAPGFICILSGPDHLLEFVNASFARLFGEREFVGRTVRQVFPDLEGQGFFELLDQVRTSGERYIAHHTQVRLRSSPAAAEEVRFLDFIYEPVADDGGEVTGIFVEGYDVTDQVSAQAALRESEAQFRLMADAVPQIVWIADATGRAVFLNRQWTLHTGATHDAEDAAEVATTLVHPDDAAASLAAFAEARRTGESFSIEQRIRSASGEYRWFLVRADPHRDPVSGEIVRWFGASTDIHDRRIAEALLRDSEARYRTIFETIEVGFCVVEVIFDGDRPVDYVFVEANPAFARQTGLSNPLGRTIRELVPDIEAHWPELYGQVVRSGEPVRYENEAAAMGRWFEVVAQRVGGAEGKRVAILVSDITERRQAEDRLRELNETLERRVSEGIAERQVLAEFVESTDAAVLACDPDFKILAINAATVAQMDRIYGTRPVVGDSLLGVLDRMPDHRAQVERHWGRALQGEEFAIVEEFGDPGRDRVFYEVRFHPLRNREGERIGAFQAAHDVTDRVRAQSELEAAQDALRQSQKMEAMGQLTGGVAHDFNNLLTPIVGSLDLLQRKGTGSEREQRLIEGALQSAERAKTLVQRLLAFARRQPLQPTAVDVASLVKGMEDLVASTTGPRIRIAIETPAELPHARADANQLEMAILNLSVNARDAMPDGGLLTIATHSDLVTTDHGSDLRPGSYVRVSVTDDGSGMEPEVAERAVEPFFSTKGIGRGTGLGLSMVHGFAAQLGGALRISSRPGMGTTVDLWLPVSDEAATAPKLTEGATQRAYVGTALLVDDEELVRMSASDMLAELGYSVVEAASAEDALNRVREGLRPDVVVTDHLMPGMTGTDLARELRRLEADLPVLIVSGYSEVEGIAAELPRLTKPFRQADLDGALAAIGADRSNRRD